VYPFTQYVRDKHKFDKIYIIIHKQWVRSVCDHKKYHSQITRFQKVEFFFSTAKKQDFK